jgi:hypothetical protein
MTAPTRQPSFADILREKMTDSPLETSEKQTDFAPEKSSFTTENLLHLLNLDLPNKRSGYIKTARPKKTSTLKAPRPPEQRWPISTLSVAAQLALTPLDLDGAKDISVSQVKRAYRRLARRLHPDLNPHAATQAFTGIKDAQDIILSELHQFAAAATKTAA